MDNKESESYLMQCIKIRNIVLSQIRDLIFHKNKIDHYKIKKIRENKDKK